MNMPGSMKSSKQQQLLTQHPAAALVIHGLLLPVEQVHQTDLASWTTIAGSKFGQNYVHLLSAPFVRTYAYGTSNTMVSSSFASSWPLRMLPRVRPNISSR